MHLWNRGVLSHDNDSQLKEIRLIRQTKMFDEMHYIHYYREYHLNGKGN
jgi:hypothetical protein